MNEFEGKVVCVDYIDRSRIGIASYHQPILVGIDNSASMLCVEPGEVKTNLELAVEMLNQIGLSEDLSENIQRTLDFSVISFSDYVVPQLNWMPMNMFQRNIRIESGGCTAFYEAVIQSINACRGIAEAYKINGIQCKRPQIFLFTDGLPTDDNKQTEAKSLCARYLDGDGRHGRKAMTLNVILLPGSNDVAAKGLSDNVRTFMAKDCVHGLPASLDFINMSCVSFSSSTVGTQAAVSLNFPKYFVAERSITTLSDSGDRMVIENVGAYDFDNSDID